MGLPSSDVEGRRAVGSVRACYPSASRVSVRPFVFHALLTTRGTVVGDVDTAGRHARETQSPAN